MKKNDGTIQLAHELNEIIFCHDSLLNIGEQLPNELWKEIIDYEGKYWVSNMGRIMSKRGNVYKIKKQHITKGGYLNIKLCSNYISKSFLVHRLVVSHFLNQYTTKFNATNHKNSIRTDNRICNLEICNYAYNNKYAYKHGHKKPVMMIGASNPQSKAIVQIDLLGKYISEFISYKEAKDSIEYVGGVRIYRYGKKIVSTKGYVFMLKEEYEKIKNNDGSVYLPKFRHILTDKRSIVQTKELRKVVQIDDFGNMIEIFDDYKKAQFKIGKKGILDVCRKRIYLDKKGNNHQYLKCGGYKWIYYDDYIEKDKK